MSQQADSVKSILFALGANFAIALSKTFAAVYTGSGSMLAESIHSFADCGNQALLLWGLKSAKKPASPDFPLGYGKETYFWSFIVALMLFSMGGLFSIYEGIHKLSQPEALHKPWLALGILAFGVVMEGISLWGCLREIKKAQAGASLWQWFRQSRESELLVVLGEDVAAMLGLTFAMLAVLLTMLTGNPVYDALGSVVIGVLLVVVAFFIGVEVKALLIGQSVHPEVKQQMHSFLAQRPEVAQLYNIITLQLGQGVMVAVKARMQESASAAELVRHINTVERDFRQHFPQVEWLFFEPDTQD